MGSRPVGRPRKTQGDTYHNENTIGSRKPAVIMETPKMTMTVEQAAKELHISRTVAYRLTKEKGFPVFNIGRSVLVNRRMLQEWIDEKTRTHCCESETQAMDEE